MHSILKSTTFPEWNHEKHVQGCWPLFKLQSSNRKSQILGIVMVVLPMVMKVIKANC